MTEPNKLSPLQKANLAALINEAQAKGITNLFAKAAISSVVGKESDYKYSFEGGYGTTDNARIRKIFTDRVAKYTDAALTVLKKNNYNFFEAVYGHTTVVGRKNGNTLPGDGYKFRGGGPNQTTFKNAYKKISDQIGVDLVSHPDLINTTNVGAKVAIQYFINAFKGAPKATLALYNSTGINDFKTLADAIGAFYHANAGFGHSVDKIKADPTGGLKKATTAGPGWYEFLSQHKTAVAATGGGAFFFDSNDSGNTNQQV